MLILPMKIKKHLLANILTYTMLGFPDKLWRLTLIKHLAVYR